MDTNITDFQKVRYWFPYFLKHRIRGFSMFLHDDDHVWPQITFLSLLHPSVLIQYVQLHWDQVDFLAIYILLPQKLISLSWINFWIIFAFMQRAFPWTDVTSSTSMTFSSFLRKGKTCWIKLVSRKYWPVQDFALCLITQSNFLR